MDSVVHFRVEWRELVKELRRGASSCFSGPRLEGRNDWRERARSDIRVLGAGGRAGLSELWCEMRRGNWELLVMRSLKYMAARDRDNIIESIRGRNFCTAFKLSNWNPKRSKSLP